MTHIYSSLYEHTQSTSWIAASKLMLLLAMTMLITACQTARAPAVPTSPRLEMVRYQKAPALQLDLEKSGHALGDPVFIRAFKKEARLEVWVKSQDSLQFDLFKTYPICKFSGGLGPKLMEGDMQAPEGFYEVSAQQLNPNSQYHLSFDLGYPNEYDHARGRTGSLLMIHGGCKSEGCYAMTDQAIEEIYLLVEGSIAGGADVPVHIFPFRMTNENMYTYFDPLWITFWRNLQEGHDMFEMSYIPPEISQAYGQGRHQYVFKDQSSTLTQLSKDLIP